MKDKDQKILEKNSIEIKEKRVWITPEINEWISVNIGLNYGNGIDGGAKSYNG